MSKIEEKTRGKIVLSALSLIMENGVSKTNLNEVAYHAGVSRITVYRYFEDKQALTRAAFLRIEQVFIDGLEALRNTPTGNIERDLDQIGNNLSALPEGDITKRFDELKRVYPEVYAEIQAVRTSTLTALFDHVFTIVEQRGLVREKLNRDVIQAVFKELIINFFENPSFQSFGLNNAELHYQVSRIFLYGVLKGEPEIS